MQIKKLHHFVPRFYLKAWARKDRLHCLQNGAVRYDSVRNVASENYFYQLQQLTDADVVYLKDFIDNSAPALRQIHLRLLDVALLLSKVKTEAHDVLPPDDPYRMEIDKAYVELCDDLHTGIENGFQPLLEMCKQGDMNFLSNDEQSTVFFQAIAAQYLRTNPFRRYPEELGTNKYKRMLRISPLLVHMIAVNVGNSLYASRKELTISILSNESDRPFLTSDQPLINLAANPIRTNIPHRFDLFYPLSPRKALLLLEPNSPEKMHSHLCNESVVDSFNLRVAASAHKQIFSNSASVLQDINNVLVAYKGCFS